MKELEKFIIYHQAELCCHITYLNSKIKVSANVFKLRETVGCKSRKMVAKKKKKTKQILPLR